MRTRRPIQAKNTERILKAVLPAEFKIVNDKDSNGYRFLNLLYGAEIDQGVANLKDVYNNSFITSFDSSKNFQLYEVTISGVPNTNYLNISGIIPIKITDENEFNNGQPTRLNYKGSIPVPMYYLTYTGSEKNYEAGFINSFSSGFSRVCWSTMSGFVGLEYFRKNDYGSGYLIIASDINQADAYVSGKYPVFVCDVGTNFTGSGDYENIYGFFTGIKSQDYSTNFRNEILYPIDSKVLSGKYPLTREIIDSSGRLFTIDHYTPYHGWTNNEYGVPVAVVDYSGLYYYDDNGKKVYFRTALNNPYGSGNYTTAYMDLEHVPISGTLKLYDIDILDKDGNATEIPTAGKILYYYKSPYMSLGTYDDPSAKFDPVYVGYEQFVPSGRGFSSLVEGHIANSLKTISWNYLHEGGGIDPGTLIYVDGSGAITNRIKINNYHTRYMVEYKYKIHDQIGYFTSLDSNGIVSLANSNPIFSVFNQSGSLKEIDFNFTDDPSYGNESSKIITLNGLEVRPYKKLNKIDFSIPIIYANGNLTSKLNINTNKKYIGYSNEFIPYDTNFRRYILNCPFDQDVFLDTVIEQDLTGNGNLLTFNNTGNNEVIKINYHTGFGKKIIKNTTGESYFYIINKSFILDNIYFEFDFKSNIRQNVTLLDIHDLSLDKYIELKIQSDGLMVIRCDGYIFYSHDKFQFDNKEKHITLKYVGDDLSSSIPTFTLYYQNKDDLGYKISKMDRHVDSVTDTVSSTYLYVYKNCRIDIGSFKIFYEVQ